MSARPGPRGRALRRIQSTQAVTSPIGLHWWYANCLMNQWLRESATLNRRPVEYLFPRVVRECARADTEWSPVCRNDVTTSPAGRPRTSQ